MKSVLIRPPVSAYSIRPRCVKPRLPPLPRRGLGPGSPLIRTGSLARSPTSVWPSFAALTYVPIPPFQSRSTGACSTQRIASAGVISADVSSGIARASRAWADNVTHFAVRSIALAPLGEHARVVVAPRGSRRFVQALPLGERDRRIRLRIEEHVSVIERGDQPDPVRVEHSVPEDVSGHVTDPHRRERLRHRVRAQLSEVPLDRFPHAASGDTELLVVVAVGASGGERVSEPVPDPLAHAVRRVRQGSRALVGGDHQVGVGAVRDPHPFWVHHLSPSRGCR